MNHANNLSNPRKRRRMEKNLSKIKKNEKVVYFISSMIFDILYIYENHILSCSIVPSRLGLFIAIYVFQLF